MSTKKATKRALLTSILAICLCLVMLIGSTFAWFTDTASTKVNKIESGTLKVALEMKNPEYTEDNGKPEWIPAENQTLDFVKAAEGAGETILWEPGCTYKLPELRIVNNGNLALKYKIQIAGATDANAGNNKNDLILLDVIDWTYKVNGETYALETEKSLGVKSETVLGYDTLTIEGHMQETAGNDYQGLSINGIAITVLATQDTVESDSYTNQYDKFAEYENVTSVAIPAGDNETVTDAVNAAIAAAKTVDEATGETKPTQIVLPANSTVTIDSGVATAPQGKTVDIKITGDKTTTVKLENTAPGSEGKLSYQDGANLTFQGITVDTSAISGICARGGEVTFINCNFTDELKQTIASKFVFSGCTFAEPVSQVGYGCKDVVFDNCEFNTDGYGIKIYSEGSPPVNLTVKSCAFKNIGTAEKSAIFLDHIVDGITYNITVDTCTFVGFTAEPTPNYNKWATRVIVPESFVKTADGQYVFSYQTGEEGGSYHKILTNDQLVVTVK